MKRLLTLLICLCTIAFVTFNYNKISNYISQRISNTHKLVIRKANDYAKHDDYMFVSISKDFVPYSYNDLLNIIYTVINNGWTSFTFYCPSEYKMCVKDMEQISKDDIILTHINNYVHPYNSFNLLNTSILESGEVTIKITHVYNEKQIKAIDTEVNRLLGLITKKDNSVYDNIKAIHDYLINNTKYDQERNEKGESKYASTIAYGTLFEHYATCNGYTDTMAIFLNKLGINNYKIATTPEDLNNSSTGHVWNAVQIDEKWLHLDLTWDDPVTNTGEDVLLHKYFLVTNSELEEADNGEVKIEEHNFRKDIYLEFNEKVSN